MSDQKLAEMADIERAAPALTSESQLAALLMMEKAAGTSKEFKAKISHMLAEELKYLDTAYDLAHENANIRQMVGGTSINAIAKLATMVKEKATQKKLDDAIDRALVKKNALTGRAVIEDDLPVKPEHESASSDDPKDTLSN